jgi:hypothetical protein
MTICPAFCWRLICDTSDDVIAWHAALGHCTVVPLELPDPPELEPEPDAPELEPLPLDPPELPLDPPLDDEDPPLEPPEPPLEPEGPVPWVLPQARRRPEARKVATHAAIRTVMGERRGEHAGCQGGIGRESMEKAVVPRRRAPRASGTGCGAAGRAALSLDTARVPGACPADARALPWRA